MKKSIFVVSLLLTASTAFAAQTIKATVGHMCCGACKAAATGALQKLDWAGDIAIDMEGKTITVTAKADQKVDAVSLMEALNKAGFPAREIAASGPVTLTLGNLCCASCVADLQAKLGDLRSEVLDKGNIKIDQAAKTVTLQPLAGKTLNLVAVLHQMERAGFSASKATLAANAAVAPPSNSRAARRAEVKR